MNRKLLLANHSLLFLCVSMYLGTGWSLILFSFPIIPQLTIDNYYMQFVPQVTAATHFFTYMTMLMIGLCFVMIVSEWKTRLRWVPIVVLLAVVAATLLTTTSILPLNKQMSSGITDPSRLQDILQQWAALNQVRVALWTVQWVSMMIYFAVLASGPKVRHET
jgi:DMSO reductase anchor subunit